MPMRTMTPQQFAHRLMTTSYSDGVTRTMAAGRDGAITVNLGELTLQERGLARAALAEIATMTGLRFAETTSGAKITYSHDGTGATTTTSARGKTIISAEIHIASDRVEPGDSYGSYAFRTYMHETLHALGLGHPQNYSKVTGFAASSIANDSWQMSLMSYFDQDENTRVAATKAYNLTPMLADYLALKQMYDAPAIHAGATVYGVGSTAGGALDHAASLGARAAFLVVDHGGTDHADFSRWRAAQVIDLMPGALSNVMGAIGNMQIASDTLIENATGGSGADRLLGNAAANRLVGGKGADVLQGRAGGDRLLGGEGDDRLWGEGGKDHLVGGNGADTLVGGQAGDTLIGGAGRDRLIGQDGADVFVFASIADAGRGAGSDVIVDFVRGADRINLSAMDANAAQPGNQDFTFVGARAFSGVAGELRCAEGAVLGDVNGDGRADFRILVSGISTLGGGDFVL
ncbi:M10 family metallopeptidase C-terminal domain-containing protein [Cereibacter sphaeroides]|uniref:M10 family metallopeptidase C-terminal domain-containing protein n=1 Tax=Cereibacter sphaeroides TaxID=1063 RepID=UPI001F3E88BD|nr:M10 family metallopeptidase C-terminal domain-containing protein [Cereibacter sphaeroides]MCE6967094.1 M10 family metallopeptidase C-terminal domain-containing protein [Cereibacter sphaeroides]